MKALDIVEKGIDYIVPEVADECRASFEAAFQDRKYQSILNKCIAEVKDLYPDAFAPVPKKGVPVPLETLDPAQSSEDMQGKLRSFLDKLLITEDVYEKQTILRNICDSYLSSMKGEVQNFHLLKAISGLEKTQAESFACVMKLMEDNSRMLDQLLEKSQQGSDEERPRSSIEFCEKFQRTLFWDEDVKLSDVYVTPQLSGDISSVTERIDKLLKRKSGDYLIIEGLPGVGKTSLLLRLANQYTEANHYFLKLSSLDFLENSSVQKALNQMKEEDPLWVNYTKSGSVLFLDGYDEISGIIPPANFMETLRVLVDKGLKIVVTTRPQYLSADRNHICMLRPYDSIQMSQWVMAYYTKAGRSAEEAVQTLQSLEEKVTDWKMMEVCFKFQSFYILL